jgi:hypothetical protein
VSKFDQDMKWIFFMLVCTILSACTNKNKKTDQTAVSPEYEVLSHANINLSDYKKDENGFILLLSGKHPNGWRGYGKKALPPKWEIIDDSLILNQNGKEGGDIIFDHTFKDFDLYLEWKISKAGNSGIFYLAREIETKDMATSESKLQPIFISAPEYQLLDNDYHPDAQLGKNGNRKSGSLYDMIPANPQTSRPYGEWNKTRITVKDGNIIHWLNNTKVVEYSFLGQQWIELLQSGKFGQLKWPLAFELMKDCGGKNHEGYIGLQDHGDEVIFRNIKIKNLL